MLYSSGGEPFATGIAAFCYRAIAGSGETPRLLLQVNLEGLLTEAVVDTGAPYLICNPNVAEQLKLDRLPSLRSVSLSIRGYRVRGDLFRLSLTLLADEGDDLEIEATAFVPALDANMVWELPAFLGMLGCLERIRFAVDPTNQTFHFGPC